MPTTTNQAAESAAPVVEREPSGNITNYVTLSADKPAFFVWANVWQTRGEFDDNSFTLYPGELRTISFAPKAPGMTLGAFRKAFSVTHLRETYK